MQIGRFGLAIVIVAFTGSAANAAAVEFLCSLETRLLCNQGEPCRDMTDDYSLDELSWRFSLDSEAQKGKAQRCDSTGCAEPFSVDLSPLAHRFWDRLGNETFAISADGAQFALTITNASAEGGRVSYGFGSCVRGGE